ncbi:uncharacterized protein LOC112084551 [Eutrema salsugineum]|uniref:uncharacterized protein LOC112084551 n=1 Tax=Eutrema salsugineum TaxID=72664 RepID=UPI000CECF244|nr:uncharacterized protein LOC112084551 [Eutrema salsugineum]
MYKLWIVFGGQPFHFGLKEFGTVTGLPCGEYPPNYDPDYQPPTPKNPGDYWRDLIGDDPKTMLADFAELLRKEPDMLTGRKIHLALLIIVDGVLIANSPVHKPSWNYVRMLEDLDALLRFPWGRESFYRTICCMRPAKKGSTINEASVELFCQQMRQATFRLQGFPLALQLVVFRACPLLPSKLPKDSDHPTLLEWTTVTFSKGNALSHSDVIEIEFSDALVVHPLIPVDQPDTEGWGDWDDEVRDKNIDHLELLVNQGHAFQKSNWHGGDSAEQLTTHNPTVPKREHQKHILNRRTKTSSPPCPYSLRPRKVTPKKKSTRTQKQIHDYLKPLPRDLHSQVNILAKQVETLTARVQKLEAKNTFRNHSGLNHFSRMGESAAFQPGLNLVDQYRSLSHEDVPTYPYHTGRDNLMDVDEIDPQTVFFVSEHGLITSENPYTTSNVQTPLLLLNENYASPLHIFQEHVEFDPTQTNHQNLNAGTDTATPTIHSIVHDDYYSADRYLVNMPNSSANSGGPISPSNNEDILMSTLDEKLVFSIPNNDAIRPLHPTLLPAHDASGIKTPKTAAGKASTTTQSSPPDDQDIQDLSDSSECSERKPQSLSSPEKELTLLFLNKTHKYNQTASPKSGSKGIQHMDVLMRFLRSRHKAILTTNRACFATFWLISHLQGKYRAFKASKDKSKHRWDELLSKYIHLNGKGLFDDVDTIYAPMNWNDAHWVGLVINLPGWSVEILDSFPTLNDQPNVTQFMEPVTTLLPYILNKQCLNDVT